MSAASQSEKKNGCYNYAMKNAATIIDAIGFQAQYKPLSNHRCFRKFLELLPPRFRKAISFLYIRDDRLYIALSHPGYKMELNYNKDVIKSLLTPFRRSQKQCSFMKAEDVIFFVSKYAHDPVEASHAQSVPRYSELADGEFEAKLSDSELAERFERIREIVKTMKRRG